MYHRSGRWAVKNKKAVAAKAEVAPALKEKTFGKEKRTIAPKDAKFYPTEEVVVRGNYKAAPHPFKLRSSITPGTVLILLAGRFRGKRVVFLKSLESGLLLVTGPFKINGVPLRRVNHRYVIATSTKIDVSGVKVPENINDAYFAKAQKEKKVKSEGEFFEKKGDKKEKKPLPEARVADQKAVDSQVLPIVAKTAQLKAYLSSRFSVSQNVLPHELKF
jgi:large subunit ribosomal protein L6e